MQDQITNNEILPEVPETKDLAALREKLASSELSKNHQTMFNALLTNLEADAVASSQESLALEEQAKIDPQITSSLPGEASAESPSDIEKLMTEESQRQVQVRQNMESEIARHQALEAKQRRQDLQQTMDDIAGRA